MPKEYAIGADIGGTNFRVAIVSENGDVIKKIKGPSGSGLIGALQNSVVSACSEAGLDPNRDMAGIGIGVAGLVDREKKTVAISPNLPSVEGVRLAESLNEHFAIPVFMENDANAAALGEKWAGAGRGFANFVLLTLGTGIGAGIICDGRLADIPAEIGHMSINADGEKCHCGNYGCLELYAAANAMKARVISALEKGSESLLRECCKGSFYKLTAEDIYSFALEGDNLAREVLKDTGRYLGVGIANIINILCPEAIILTGGLLGAWNIYVQEAIREASRRSFKPLFDRVKIIPSSLGDDAGIIGAAGIVFSALGRLQMRAEHN